MAAIINTTTPVVQMVLNSMTGVQEEDGSDGEQSSYNKLMGTVIPLLIISIPMVLAFLYLRRYQNRVYAPRTYLDVLKDQEKTPKPALGYFDWIGPFRKMPDEFVLNHQSLDNYLFIRFFKMVSLICLVGAMLTWPILLPINYRGGGGLVELDSFTFANVEDPNQYYWHTAVAWVLSIYVMYIISRETIYYINLRQAYLTTPRNAARLSTRIVLFTGVPEDYRDERWIKADISGIKRVWIATDCTELDAAVSTMRDNATTLEDLEIKLSGLAVKKQAKGETRFTEDPERHYGNATRQWVSEKDRPTVRINPPYIGRKVDAVQYYRDQLKASVPIVEQLQRQLSLKNGKILPALFVEFESQRAAQAAYSAPFWKQPYNIEPAMISIAKPDEIVWENLRIGKVERWIRTVVANVIIVLLIIFWSIPVGIAGSLADLDTIAQNFAPLSFLSTLSPSAKSMISGLLPTLIISALLALVPIICRYAARKAGSMTLAQVELRTQGWYFAFQVVQVFLITTFSSGAATVAKQIIQDPAKAPTLLAQNLPKASTFYLSFFVLQGVAVTASTIFQIAPFLIMNFVAPYLDTTPRKKFERYTALPSLSWGDTYPKFTNFAIIALSYACISPLVLGFAFFGLSFLYLAFRYNVFYVLTMLVDTKGDAYGRAMQHLSTGVYLSEICLIGLMTAKGAQGPAKLMTLLLIVTAIYQIYLNLVLTPLQNTLSDELMAANEEEALAEAAEQGGSTPINPNANQEEEEESTSVQPRAPLAAEKDDTLLTRLLSHQRRGGLFAPFLFNGSRSKYPSIRANLWDAFPGEPAPQIPDETIVHAYHHPSITAKVPKIWLARDGLGVSACEVRELEGMGIEASDEGAEVDGRGRVKWEEGRSVRDMPGWEERVEY